MSNLPDYDEITRLRLRLAEVELQRDAFKAMAVKAVTEVIREVLQKEKAPAIDYASLAKGYDEKAPQAEVSYDRVSDDICTTYVVDNCVVTKAEYEVARRKSHG